MSRIIKFAFICRMVYKLKDWMKKETWFLFPLAHSLTHLLTRPLARSFIFACFHTYYRNVIFHVSNNMCFFYSFSQSIFISISPPFSILIVISSNRKYKLCTNKNGKVSKAVTVVVSGSKRLTFDMDRHNEIKIYLLVRVFNERMDLFVLAFICLSVTRFFASWYSTQNLFRNRETGTESEWMS